MNPPTLTLIGIALVLVYAMPRVLRGKLLTLPILFVGLGYLAYTLPIQLPFVDPESNAVDRKYLEYLTEFIVIISLGGIGLTLDKKPSWANWSSGILLVAVAMPLCIAAVALLGWGVLGLGAASAILLGAVLAPTDPVLAESVQVGPPNDGVSADPVRLSLSLEAGLNDGLAFPFVYLAIGLAGAASVSSAITEWLWMDVLVRIAVGVGAGALAGLAASILFFAVLGDDEPRGPHLREGIFAVGAVLLTYGLTEWLEGYGFLAVFVASVVARRRNSEHPMHADTYAALEQVETALMSLFLLGFGGALATGALDDLTWPGVGVGLALLFGIRPLFAMLSLLGCSMTTRRKLAVSVFGIRGLGSFYYLAYATNSADFVGADAVWSVVAFTILVSVVLHGPLTNPILRWATAEDSDATPGS